MKIVSVLTLLVILSPLLRPEAYAQARAARRTPAAKSVVETKPAGQSLPLNRVILYSNGVAYFERRGKVTGHAEINLPFKQSQVDDVLKSMVVLDLGKGRIGAVSYNSSQPASARLSDIPFSVEAGTDNDTEGGLAAVLKQLQGARVNVAAATRQASGAILTIDEKKSQIDANKPPVTTRTLVVASETGELASFDLSEIRSVKLLDEGARHDVNEFATASASARRRDAKTIVVTSDGEGTREMVVSYTVAAPIWKTSYRVVLDSTGKPFFQGWAIVDNVGEEDWSNVQLSLVSGMPVSFIQPIQQPMYRYRPVVPIPEDLQLNPQVYEPEVGSGVGSGVGHGVAGGVAGGVPGGVPGGAGFGAGESARGRAMRTAPPPPPKPAEPVTAISDAITSVDSGVEAAASGSEVGDLFEYRIDQPVTLRRDRSALIPILQTRMEGERVSIYNEAARKDRPMGGMRLKNTSPLTLEGGSMTVIDGDAYAGEALMERLKPGEERFISFALDLGTLVTARSKNDREPAFMVRVVNGVFQAHYHQTETKSYTITNQTDKPRAVYVEHAIRNGWTLSKDTQAPVGKTASLYRFRVQLEPRATVELPVTESRALMDTYDVSSLTSRQVEVFVSRRYIDDATRAALEKIIDIKSKIAAVYERAAAADREVAEISADQQRLRENIKALKDTAETKQLIARYVTKAGEQETRLEQLSSERRSTTAERAKLETELEAAIHALSVDRTL